MTTASDPLDPTGWEASTENAAFSDEPSSSDTAPAGELKCENCGRHFSHEGRGRKPKKCLECREAKGSRTTGITRPRKGARTKAEREADEIAAKFRQSLAMLALFVSMADPVDGKAILAGSDGLAKATGTILEKNDKVRILLSSSSTGGGYVALFGYLLIILVPILAHHGLIPGEITRDGKKVLIGEMFEQIPDMLLGLQKKMATAEKDLAARIVEAQNGAPANAA